VFDDFKEVTTLGAMANVWNALTKIDESLSVKLNPISIGEAIVLVNRKNSERIAKANLNMKTKEPIVYESKWHHIMYINRLPDLSFVDKIKFGVVSADVSGPLSEENFKYLDRLDYLFISSEDLSVDIKKLTSKVKGKVILHHPAGSFVISNKTSFEVKTKCVKNINVLGAGDIFSAHFISYMIKNYDLKRAIKLSHKNTSKILVERK